MADAGKKTRKLRVVGWEVRLLAMADDGENLETVSVQPVQITAKAWDAFKNGGDDKAVESIQSQLDQDLREVTAWYPDLGLYRTLTFVSAKGVPLIKQRCSKPMPRGGVCGMPPNHLGRCRTPEGVAKAYARNIARHKRVVDERHLWLDQYKLARGCVDCGYRKAAVALDFDHRDPEMKISGIAGMLWKNISLIEAEIAKCVVRCACCHRIKTHALDESRNRRRPGSD